MKFLRAPDIQLGLECFQQWDIHHLSQHTEPVFHHPHCKTAVPFLKSESTLFQFKNINPCPITRGSAKISIPILLEGFLVMASLQMATKYPSAIHSLSPAPKVGWGGESQKGKTHGLR